MWPRPDLRESDPLAYAGAYADAFMRRPMAETDPVQRLPADTLEKLVAAWPDPRRPPSRHCELAISAAFRRQARGLAPLEAELRVPGCGCPVCTELPETHASRKAVQRGNRARRVSPGRGPLDLESARQVPILEVAGRLHLGQPVGAASSKYRRVLCPMHDDRKPSLCLNVSEDLWYCGPCGEGGDGIRLVERVLRCTFVEAVRELTGAP